jgi:hypothetical protein
MKKKMILSIGLVTLFLLTTFESATCSNFLENHAGNIPQTIDNGQWYSRAIIKLKGKAQGHDAMARLFYEGPNVALVSLFIKGTGANAKPISIDVLEGELVIISISVRDRLLDDGYKPVQKVKAGESIKLHTFKGFVTSRDKRDGQGYEDTILGIASFVEIV